MLRARASERVVLTASEQVERYRAHRNGRLAFALWALAYPFIAGDFGFL